MVIFINKKSIHFKHHTDPIKESIIIISDNIPTKGKMISVNLSLMFYIVLVPYK